MNYKKIVRLTLGLVLLLFLLSQLNISSLIQALMGIDIFIYSTAIIICAFANLLCALRWRSLSSKLESDTSRKIFILVYFESIAANCILPGGILGGDVWRTARIAKENEKFNKFDTSTTQTTKNHLLKLSGLSVIADRIHGFWSLCIMGIGCSLLFFLFTLENESITFQLIQDHSVQIFIYLTALIFISLLPFLLKLLVEFFPSNIIKIGFLNQYSNIEINNLWRHSNNKKTILTSLTSQILFGLGFWICLHSIGVDLNIFIILIIVPGIFFFASLPVAIGGFGPREAGSLFFLLPLSINSEYIFISSVLFGLISTILGVITLLISLILESKKR